jgi:hypothetical protein
MEVCGAGGAASKDESFDQLLDAAPVDLALHLSFEAPPPGFQPFPVASSVSISPTHDFNTVTATR